MVSQVGKPHPAYSTGCGKAILSFQTEEDLVEILHKIEQQGMIKSASNTVTDLDEFQRQLTNIRETGYAITCDEFQEGMRVLLHLFTTIMEKSLQPLGLQGLAKNFVAIK